MKKVLNLYAGIGGNRKLWKDVEVTAVEGDQAIADIYQNFFPKDKVIVCDAHEYLLENYKEFDFIWSSPPCQSHSQIRKRLGVDLGKTKPIFPDMRLYQEIIFLKHHAKCKWVVENVVPYYKILIEAQHIMRHLFWANFEIDFVRYEKEKNLKKQTVSELQERIGFDLSKFKIKNKRQILRNCVSPVFGLHVFNNAKKTKKEEKI